MSPTSQRDKVAKLAKQDPAAALDLARVISDPWFKAQALANVARHTHADPLPSACEAKVAADCCSDSFKRTAVRAWEIAALAEREQLSEAREALLASVKQAALVTPAGSQAEALTLLLEASTRIGIKETRLVSEKLLALFVNEPHWRCVRAVKQATAILTKMDVKVAQQYVDSIGDPKIKSACQKEIEKGGAVPRPFFL